MFDAKQFLLDFDIEFAERHKHVTRGWVGIVCPFCTGHDGYHGGFHLSSGRYRCWRCGWHPTREVIAGVLGIDFTTARGIEAKYTSEDIENPAEDTPERPVGCRLPEGLSYLSPPAVAYLKSRHFDPERITREWGVYDSGNVGPYSFRLIAPITFNGRVVSYTGRDYTGRQEMKYKSCYRDTEVIPHRNIVYGFDQARDRKTVLVIEGPADVWRMGRGAVGLFGIDWRKEQAILIARNFQRVFILLDSEPTAQTKADKLWWAVTSLNPTIDGEVLEIEGLKDPAEMTDDDAVSLMKELGAK